MLDERPVGQEALSRAISESKPLAKSEPLAERANPTTSPAFIPEILAPAGGPEAFFAALHTGADAVYLGLSRFNARARATNFSLETLAEHLPIARQHGMKVLVTLNTLIKDGELDELLEVLAQLSTLDVHALIVQDLGLAAICRKHFPSLRLHSSTQMAIHNADGVRFAMEQGFRRVVLARELTATEMRKIRSRFPRAAVELEAFCHGSLCYSYSGLCFFSGAEDARSGNRGECAYTCRKPYRITSEAGGGFLFSMKDLSTLHSLETLIGTGVDTLKIEGRKKDAQYVASTVRAYRTKLDEYFGYPTLREEAPSLAHELYRPDQKNWKGIEDALRLSYSREQTSLFLKGRYAENVIDLDNPTHSGLFVGLVKKVIRPSKGDSFDDKETGRILLQAETSLELYDGMRIEAPKAELSERYHNLRPEFSLRNLRVGGRKTPECRAGDSIEIEVPKALADCVAPGDRVYKIRSNALKVETEKIARPTGDERRGHRLPVDIRATLRRSHSQDRLAGEELSFELEISFRELSLLKSSFPLADMARRSAGLGLEEELREAFGVFGEGRFEHSRLSLQDPEALGATLFVPRSKLKECRREIGKALEDALSKSRQDGLEEARIALGERVPSADAPAQARLGIKIDRLDALGPIASFFQAREKVSLGPQGDGPSPALAPNEIVFEPKRSLLGSLKSEELWRQLGDWCQEHRNPSGEPILLTCALPTVIRAWDEPLLMRCVKAAWEAGVRRFEVGNAGALVFLERAGLPVGSESLCLVSDFTLYALNRAASKALGDLGLRRIALSLENDRADLKRHAQNWLAAGASPQIILYKDTPLFIAESCTLTALHDGCPSSAVCGYRSLEIEDESGERYTVAHESCKSIVYGKRAYSVTEHLRDALEWGVREFRVDFLTRAYEPDEIRTILSAALEGKSVAETVSGNWAGRLL